MMLDSKSRRYRKHKSLFGLTLLLFVSIACFAFSTTGSDDFHLAKTEVLLRKIGHEILLQSADTTSRILPVNKIAENEYQIRFEHEFTFEPEFLVNTTKRLLAKGQLSGDFIVNVLNCDNSGVAYGFAISGKNREDIVPCIGREQPTGCYIINIKFNPTETSTAKHAYVLGGVSLLAFVGFIILVPAKSEKNLRKDPFGKTFTFGSVLFDVQAKQLAINGETIDLTATETRLLLIFSSSPNEIIERSRLQKEVWEDEGVIVGRSLDMFISKLRKKLQSDPNIKIAVLRGKGYRLEVG